MRKAHYYEYKRKQIKIQYN